MTRLSTMLGAGAACPLAGSPARMSAMRSRHISGRAASGTECLSARGRAAPAGGRLRRRASTAFRRMASRSSCSIVGSPRGRTAPNARKSPCRGFGEPSAEA